MHCQCINNSKVSDGGALCGVSLTSSAFRLRFLPVQYRVSWAEAGIWNDRWKVEAREDYTTYTVPVK
jgi:hypothetical protein